MDRITRCPHRHPIPCLRAVRLNPGVENRGIDIPYNESFTIRVEYDVNEDTDNSTVWIALQSLEGAIVFVTSDYDMDPSKLKNERRALRH